MPQFERQQGKNFLRRCGVITALSEQFLHFGFAEITAVGRAAGEQNIMRVVAQIVLQPFSQRDGKTGFFTPKIGSGMKRANARLKIRLVASPLTL